MRVVVTGSNKGIGLELARQLAERGDNVIATCRKNSPDLVNLNVEVYEDVDVTDEVSVKRFADTIGADEVNILINNAGILTRETLDDLDWDRIRHQFEVNTLGPLRMTKALLPNLKQGSKVAIVSSRVGSIADNSSGGNYGYRMSKAAVNMAGVNLAHDLKPRGVAVILLHPGYIRTDLTGGQGASGPEQAARGLIKQIDSLTLERSGTFWHVEGYGLPW